MKKLINSPNTVVSDLLEGLAAANPQLEYCPEYEIVVRRDKSKAKTVLISGGGSGHEPAHAGYVGKGMLDAAVCGNVFASPSPDRILAAVHKTAGEKGVLMIVKNYSGDIMNFEMARELAELEGIKVESVIVRDDVAVPESTFSTGRRGIAGTVFVHKIAGAAAEMGLELAEVKKIAQDVADHTRSMGVAMTPCILPAVGRPGFALAENEMEIGMGIHGEPGTQKTTMKTAKETAEILCSKIMEDLDFKGSEVAVIVNGLGGTPLMELYIMLKEVDRYIRSRGVRAYRYFVGNYMTSLEMAGCSLSMLKLNPQRKMLLDAPADTPAWKEVAK